MRTRLHATMRCVGDARRRGLGPLERETDVAGPPRPAARAGAAAGRPQPQCIAGMAGHAPAPPALPRAPPLSAALT